MTLDGLPESTVRHHLPVYEIGGALYVVDVARERLFRYDGASRNPRVIVQADAAVWSQALDTVHWDGSFVLLQHHVAGIEKRLVPQAWLDEPLPLFVEPTRLRYGEVDAFLGGEERGE